MTDLPAGYAPLSRSSPFLDATGPFYSRQDERGLIVALRVEPKHANARGFAHGGLLATLADVALGYATAFSQSPPVALLTANLSIDYAGSAKIGDWIEAHVDVQKIGSRMAFANAYLSVGSQRIARASAVFGTDHRNAAADQH
jgi:uncharacterized protein (TIGR00369 family)